MQRPNPLVDEIKNSFYQYLVNRILDLQDFDKNNIDNILKTQIQRLVRQVISDSSVLDRVVRLPYKVSLTVENCPLTYRPLFDALLEICTAKAAGREVDNDILVLSNNITAMQSFAETIKGVKNYIFETKGIVTTDAIRETFYNEIPLRFLDAQEHGWITVNDMDTESFIYYALPALTLLEVLRKSENIDGVRLFNGTILTPGNCPQEEEFFKLFSAVLPIKDELVRISKDPKQWQALSYICLSRPGDLPKELEPYRTPEVISCATLINDTTFYIGERKVFKEKIDGCREFCIDMAESKAPSP